MSKMGRIGSKRKVYITSKHHMERSIHTRPSYYMMGKEAVEAYIQRFNAQSDWLNQQGKAKEIMVDGVWQVGPEERPKGWEKIGGREKNADSEQA